MRSTRVMSRSVGMILLALAAVAGPWPFSGCTTPTDNENENLNDNSNLNINDNANENDNQNVNGNDNDNSSDLPGADEIFLQLDTTPSQTDAELARALSGAGTEFKFYGNSDGAGEPTGLTEIDMNLSSGVAIAGVFDSDTTGESSRPSSFLSEDEEALLLSYSEDDEEVVTVEYAFVAADGESVQLSAVLDSSSSARKRQQNFPAQDAFDICEDLLADIFLVTDAVYEGCESDNSSIHCSGSIAQAIAALGEFCTNDVIFVSDLLSDDLAIVPSLELPLLVTVDADPAEVTPGSGVLLRGRVLGGDAPYQYSWAVTDGPVSGLNIIANNDGSLSTGSVTLTEEGAYTIRLTVIDNAGEVTFFDATVVASSDPGEFSVAPSAVESEDDPFTFSLMAEVTGGASPYAYEWLLLDGPGDVEFSDDQAAQTDATFSEAGNYILQITASDDLGAVSVSSLALTVIDPATSLIAVIDYPSCGTSTNQDTCVLLGSSIALSVDLTNEEGTGSELQYLWTVIQPNGQSTTTTTSTLNLTATIPGTVTVQVTVTDTVKEDSDSDQITVQVVESGTLAVDILSDGQAKYNQAETLIAQVSGFSGLLTYGWEIVTGAGSFGSTSTQSVSFTPQTIGTVTVKVTVTDSSTSQTASATESLSVASFTVDIGGSSTINTNTSATYTSSLSSDAPSSVTYNWTATKQDSSDSLSIALVNSTQSSVQLVATGDGVFDLRVAVTDSGNSQNVAQDTLAVTVLCSSADDPVADVTVDGLTAIIGTAGATVDLVCTSSDTPDPTPTYAWTRTDSISGVSFTINNASSDNASFVMPNSPSSVVEGSLILQCKVSNDLAFCDGTDSGRVYFTPAVAPAVTNQTVAQGAQVSLACSQSSGSEAATYNWRQVDSDGEVISPPNVSNYNVSSIGVLSFTAPSFNTTLYFECQGIIDDVDGDLSGSFSSQKAQVNVGS